LREKKPLKIISEKNKPTPPSNPETDTSFAIPLSFQNMSLEIAGELLFPVEKLYVFLQ
jgi:hypothetical protein